jgi:hypothetical protein
MDNLVNSTTVNSENRSVNVWFFLKGEITGEAGTEFRFPRVGELSVPLDADGQSGVVSLAGVGGMNFEVGMLDELSILVIGHDIDRDQVWCVPRPGPGQPPPKPPCPAPPARSMMKSYDLGQRFGNGTHSERSVVVADESFAVVFRVDLRCPRCAQPSPPSR